MLRTSVIIIAAGLALAVPAFAEDVHVSLVGKDAATVHRDIINAANQVCEQEAQSVPFYSLSKFDVRECVRLTVAQATASLHDQQLTKLDTPAGDRLVVGSR